MADIEIRAGVKSEHALVLATFCRGFSEAPAARDVPWSVLGDLMGRLLARWALLVAFEPDEPGEVLGYLVHDGPRRVAWLYVKPPYRGRGVARALLGAGEIQRGDVESPFVPSAYAMGGRFRLLSRPWLPLVV